MRKNKEKVYLSMALVLLMTVSIFFYALYIRQQIYYEGTQAMLETYEQVNKTLPSATGMSSRTGAVT